MAKKREEYFCFRNYLAALQNSPCLLARKKTKREVKQLSLRRGDGEQPIKTTVASGTGQTYISIYCGYLMLCKLFVLYSNAMIKNRRIYALLKIIMGVSRHQPGILWCHCLISPCPGLRLEFSILVFLESSDPMIWENTPKTEVFPPCK